MIAFSCVTTYSFLSLTHFCLNVVVFLYQIYWLSLLTTFSKQDFILPSISLVRNCCKHLFCKPGVYFVLASIAEPEPGFCSFSVPGTGMENNPDPGYEIRDKHV